MPKRTDIKSILIIGSGPIVIGQACEFDYSGSQACKALREEGYRVILLNSNPATIMTDPTMSDRTYIEPIVPEVVEEIIKKESPDAVLPTMGGQTGLNVAFAVASSGVLDRYGVEMIGAKREAIEKAEARERFRQCAAAVGIETPSGAIARSVNEAIEAAEQIGYPIVVRPAFTLGGAGGGIAYNREELAAQARYGLDQSMVDEILVEEYLLAWKEYELEVVRDLADNVVIVCTMENVDPMGIHTGDSITVAPAQTLSDREYQRMRDASIAIMREIGVETGGSNVQFAVEPQTGRMVIIEMNPRVSRSSALASKATGFPIARVAAKLAVGYRLDELKNDITRDTPASFEPAIDYCVVKIPRFAFEKFRGASSTLGTSMKSVGEVMAIGRTFREALQKGLRSLELDKGGLAGLDPPRRPARDDDELSSFLSTPGPERVLHIRYALERGWSVERISRLSGFDPWFVDNLAKITEVERELRDLKATPESFRMAKESGFSDRRLSELWNMPENEIRAARKEAGVEATFRLVDTCAGEFEAYTPYFYSTYESENESRASGGRTIVILGGGPNRIGQGIEFDYCCCHAAFALREIGYEAVMVNSNPETVSTDFDTSTRLYFEPLTLEDVLNIIDCEKPEGVIVQLGGQTPLNLAVPLESAGINILGTSPHSIELAEDRGLFEKLVRKLGLRQTECLPATTAEQAAKFAQDIGYPVIVRPSFVLGGRAMEIVYDEQELTSFLPEAMGASSADGKHPILVDKFLEDAIEVDVDAVADEERCVVGGIMEHVEEAGVHSGDATCVLPPHTLSESMIERLKEQTRALALELNVRGLINVQFAIRKDQIYVLEVNPRASRTVPFVCKATGLPLVSFATKVMVGHKLKDLGFTRDAEVDHFAVKEPVFPFVRFPGEDVRLGPEMRSTGEVMGIAPTLGEAFAKAKEAAGKKLPSEGTVFLSVCDRDKRDLIPVARRLSSAGFKLIATRGTASVLARNDIEAGAIPKVSDGKRPNVVDLMLDGKVRMVINTPSGRSPRRDEVSIRTTAVRLGVPLATTMAGAAAAVGGIEATAGRSSTVRPLQEMSGNRRK